MSTPFEADSEPASGHNSIAAGQLASIIERAERLEEEKKAVAEDIKELWAEAKANGFDTTALKQIVKLRKTDTDKERERQTILEVYMSALGQLADTPLGQWAVKTVRAVY